MRRLFVLCLLASMWIPVYSCDACSVAGAGDFLQRRNRLTYMFRMRELRKDIPFTTKSLARAKHLEHFEERGDIRELYFAHELRGTFLLGERFNVTVGIPLVTNYRSVDGYTSADLSGLGDIWTLLQRDMLAPTESAEGWRWMMGVGLKLPSGSTDMVVNDVEPDLDIQPGSGSVDLLIQTSLIRHWDGWIGRTDNMFKINGQGADEYRYGNGLSSENVVGRLIDGDVLDGMIYVGPYLEIVGQDEDEGRRVDTRMTIVYGEVGGSMQYKDYAVDLRLQHQLWHKENDLQLPTTQRLIASLQWIF